MNLYSFQNVLTEPMDHSLKIRWDPYDSTIPAACSIIMSVVPIIGHHSRGAQSM